jgi:hypothetical protein
LAFGWKLDPIKVFDDTGTLGTIPILIVYLVTTAALPVYILRFHNSEFHALNHGVIPFLGVVLTLFPLWGLVQPGQPGPFNLFPAMAGIRLVVSIIYGIILGRRFPNLVHSIGSYVADEEH